MPSESVLLRFLRARDLNIDKVSSKLPYRLYFVCISLKFQQKSVQAKNINKHGRTEVF